jgi:hypothetical protein
VPVVATVKAFRKEEDAFRAAIAALAHVVASGVVPPLAECVAKVAPPSRAEEVPIADTLAPLLEAGAEGAALKAKASEWAAAAELDALAALADALNRAVAAGAAPSIKAFAVDSVSFA